MSVYYNENDEDKAAWLRELIRERAISTGEVDTRSIAEVRPEDLAGFSQHHFFAGIGVWSYALRLAGWPDDRPVWTGSCPCPSFSAAGKGGGFDDPRHLWPDWARLIRKCRPATLFGEQADDAIGYGWLDLVQTDLEREEYAVGKAVLGACSVGAPHIRQRLYFVAHSAESRFSGDSDGGTICEGQTSGLRSSESERDGGNGERMDFSDRSRRTPRQSSATPNGHGSAAIATSAAGKLADSRWFRAQPHGSATAAGFVNGFWRGADWVLRKRWNSEDWEWCPTEPFFVALASRASTDIRHLRGENQQAEEKVDGNASLDKDGRRPLRTVREAKLQTSRPPQGREPEEQRQIELADFVRLLPQTIALAELRGDAVTTKAVQALLQTCGASRLMQYTPHAIEEAWRSTSDESKNRLQVRLDQGGFVMAGTFPLAAGVKNRVLKLKGYGDAICAEVAKAFIQASSDT